MKKQDILLMVGLVVLNVFVALGILSWFGIVNTDMRFRDSWVPQWKLVSLTVFLFEIGVVLLFFLARLNGTPELTEIDEAQILNVENNNTNLCQPKNITEETTQFP